MSKRSKMLIATVLGITATVLVIFTLVGNHTHRNDPKPTDLSSLVDNSCPLDETGLFLDQRCTDMKVISNQCQINFDLLAFESKVDVGPDAGRWYYYDDNGTARVTYTQSSPKGIIIICPNGIQHQLTISQFNRLSNDLGHK